MAGRPIDTTIGGFRFDFHLASDRDFKTLLLKFGATGFGITMLLLAEIGKSPDRRLHVNMKDLEMMGLQLHCDHHKLQEIIEWNTEKTGVMQVEYDNQDFNCLWLTSPWLEERVIGLLAKRQRQAAWARQRYNRIKEEPAEPVIPAKPVKPPKEPKPPKPPKAVQAKLIPDEIHPIQQYINTTYPKVAKLETKLSFAEGEKLREKYSRGLINFVLKKLENSKHLKNYTSTYLTMDAWCTTNQPNWEDIKKGNRQGTTAKDDAAGISQLPQNTRRRDVDTSNNDQLFKPS